MANIKSQIKRNRQNEKRRLRNKSVRAELRTRTKSAVTAAEAGAEDSAEAAAPGREADRQGGGPGRDPQEHGGQPQVAPGAARRRHRGRRRRVAAPPLRALRTPGPAPAAPARRTRADVVRCLRNTIIAYRGHVQLLDLGMLRGSSACNRRPLACGVLARFTRLRAARGSSGPLTPGFRWTLDDSVQKEHCRGWLRGTAHRVRASHAALDRSTASGWRLRLR